MTTQTLQTPLLTATVTTAGSGPPILYLHDILFDHINQNGDLPPFLQALTQTHTLHAPALPGFRDLKELPAFEDIHDYILLITDLITNLSLKQPHLIGTGLGGWIAAETATFYPHTITSLTLINSFGIMDNEHPPARFFDAAAPNPLGGRHEVRHMLFAEPESQLAQKLMPDFPDDAPNEEFFKNVHAAARIGWDPPAFYDPRLASRLHRITVPTHVIWGAANTLVDTQYGQTLASKIPDSTFTIIDNAGHAITAEKPEELAKTINSLI
jgi:pimeloyl-ACP methyl ester carboxylesterase